MQNSDKCDSITRLDMEFLREKYRGRELEDIIDKIKAGYPVQYAIGDVQFLDYNISVDERVLIPRFETELLVDKLCRIIRDKNFFCGKVVDLCTGSGAIAIALKAKWPMADVFALDISEDALALAKENALKNDVEINFRQQDVLTGLQGLSEINLLVANPPYVGRDEIVSPETRFEPEIALYPGDDDILFYKRILEHSKDIMHEKSIIAFEIGSLQGQRVGEYAKECYPEANITVEKDYNGFDRFVFILNGIE